MRPLGTTQRARNDRALQVGVVPESRRRQTIRIIEGRENMVRTAGVLAALALMPAAAAAQNGYSFIDADKSAVRFGVATVKPGMSCANVASLGTTETTILSARIVPA